MFNIFPIILLLVLVGCSPTSKPSSMPTANAAPAKEVLAEDEQTIYNLPLSNACHIEIKNSGGSKTNVAFFDQKGSEVTKRSLPGYVMNAIRLRVEEDTELLLVCMVGGSSQQYQLMAFTCDPSLREIFSEIATPSQLSYAPILGSSTDKFLFAYEVREGDKQITKYVKWTGKSELVTFRP